MNSSIEELLDVKSRSNGGKTMHPDRINGNMKREIKRIITRNRKRNTFKQCPIRHLQIDLKDRNIRAGRHAIRMCLRKDLKYKPYVARKMQ